MRAMYEQDFYHWTQEQATLLKDGRLADLDIQHLAEEIEDMGKEQRNALRSLLRIALVHLIKLAYSRSDYPRIGWIDEIVEYRAQIEDRLADNPSLRAQLDTLFIAAWPQARRLAETAFMRHGEQVSLPVECPFSLDNVLDQDFLP